MPCSWLFQILSRERPLGAFFTGHLELLGRKLLLPFGVSLLNFFHFNDSFALTGIGKLHNFNHFGALGEGLREAAQPAASEKLRLRNVRRRISAL